MKESLMIYLGIVLIGGVAGIFFAVARVPRIRLVPFAATLVLLLVLCSVLITEGRSLYFGGPVLVVSFSSAVRFMVVCFGGNLLRTRVLPLEY